MHLFKDNKKQETKLHNFYDHKRFLNTYLYIQYVSIETKT